MTAGLPPPAIVQPSPYEVSYGLVTGSVARGAERIVIRAGGRLLADRRLRGRHFTVRVDLPLRETTVSVTAVDARGRRATSRVSHVLGLPRAAAPHLRSTHEDLRLEAQVRRLGAGFAGSAAVYVADLTSGAGAAWNARAQLPAASTLKLGIAIAALSRTGSVPTPGSFVDTVLRRMLVVSGAAVLAGLLAGVCRAGVTLVFARGAEVTTTITIEGTRARIDHPDRGEGSHTTTIFDATANKVVRLYRHERAYAELAAPPAGHINEVLGVMWRSKGGAMLTPDDARYLLYVLAHVRPGQARP